MPAMEPRPATEQVYRDATDNGQPKTRNWVPFEIWHQVFFDKEISP